ncbi:MAG: FKBP-type peptidyl-prolyl cis-trans isomerase [Sphingobacteriales bacterium]
MKWLFLILLIGVVLAGCGKTQSSLAQYRAQAAIDDKIVANYIAENNLTGIAKKTNDTSGVYYIVLQQGQGNDLFTTSTRVTVSDTGKLLGTGKIFTETNTFHPSYVLGQVMLGWQLGIPKINTGGIVRLIIPSRYAYGPNAQPSLGLPANAILNFDIQLYNVTN